MIIRITSKIALLPFSFLVKVQPYFQLFEYDIDDWMDYQFKAGDSMRNEFFNT
jgi:hypothetical protein